MDEEKVLSLENLILALSSNNIKIKQLINDMLLLMQQDIDNNISNHINNNIIHVTQDDKDLWNSILDNAKAYANTLFNEVTSFTIEIVDELPTENIKQMTIYFIRNDYDNESDYYDEYMYINNKWEIIGSTFVNLAPYLLREEFESYKQHIANKFLDYKTSNELNDILNDYLPIEVFQRLIEDYAKKEQLHEHNNKDILDKLSESQNGVLLYDNKEIEGGSNITISENENNAIKQKDNGIFVEDKTQEINNLKIRTEQINIAQKTINGTNDFYFIGGQNNDNTNTLSITQKTSFIKYLREIGSYEVNTGLQVSDDGYITLTEGIWDLTFGTINDCNYPIDFYWVDRNENIYGNTGYCPRGAGSNYDIDANAIIIVNPGKELEITAIMSTDANVYIEPLYTFAKIIRINTREIDPVEHINTSQGIEDTPVGHIISYMGNKAPKHYLICDGTEYNITEYPNLAQHFKDEFGTYNYFGGDGLNTFCVPDLRGEFLRGTGENSHENQGSGEDVGEHQDATTFAMPTGGSSNGFMRSGVNTENPGNYVTNIDSSLGESFNSRTASSSTNKVCIPTSYQYTSRPTNTSVLYCIKYEPTYYMSVGSCTIQGFEDLTEEELNNLITDTINLLNQ